MLSTKLLVVLLSCMAIGANAYCEAYVTVNDLAIGFKENPGLITLYAKSEDCVYRAEDWTFGLDIPNGDIHPECHIEGTADLGSYGTQAPSFVIHNEANYLRPCGPNKGLTVVCNGPAATCQG